MDIEAEIRNRSSNPEQLEGLYRSLAEQNQVKEFQAALLTCYRETPENQLFGAWYYRLQGTEQVSSREGRTVNWILAVPLGILTGLIYWALSDFQKLVLLDEIPYLLLWWSPIATMGALVFLAVTSKSNHRRSVAVFLGLLVMTIYVTLMPPMLEAGWKQEQLLVLGAIHLPLLSWVALGISEIGLKSSIEDRFAFLKKSIEVMVVAGLYLIAGVAFGAITIGMFAALNITFPEIWLRLIGAGGFGLLPVMAVATIYDPNKSPSEQDFEMGLSQFISTMMRLLLPLTLIVLAIYIVVIPFNFLEPYNNRELLIVYNLMLFAIMGLLLGATPFKKDDVSPRVQRWLRNAIISTVILVVLVSIYALSATVYRTFDGGLTFNRLTVIGWNVVNIYLLILLIYRYFKDGSINWVTSLQGIFALATAVYTVWAMALMVLLPLISLIL